MPSPRVLTQRELNRALLARQSLLERVPLPIPRALERMCGLQDQYAPSGYIGLWTRLRGFRRPDLTRALEQRSVIQATLMRATIHLVSRTDFWPIATAIDEPLREWWFRSTKRRLEEKRLRAIDARGRALLADGPQRKKEILDALGLDAGDFVGVGLWTPLVRVPPSGTWENRRADLYALAEEWVGPCDSTPGEGQELLIRRYLGAFGPASRADISTFTGLPPKTIDAVTDRLSLRTFRTEADETLLDLRGAPLPPPNIPAPVRFLPTWDATLLVHARRTQVLPERYRPSIFSTKMPQSIGTFLVDGQVAGTWRSGDGRVTTSPFEPLPKAIRRAVDQEAAALAAFIA
ncbi:MAG TPA: winged helix DNA-binding domain-containing protein [Actinomycetota bacterium]|nr:winged helix DNA-binding domain-containing protein [Actinomycetota bacterium]